MNKKQASSIIENTFNKAFNRDEFIDFAGNLFNLRSTDYSQRSVGIFDTYKQHVQSLEVVAKFSDGKNEIDVLIVTLIKDTSLDKARTMQRNFVARYLSEKQGDAAIVAFTSPDAQDWRFSLIKMDYKFKATDTGIKVEQEVTPAKRWSFLVGKNENSHTAQSQLVGILANDEVAPTLDELEQAFSIETVTNEFFAKYTDLFLRMKESLDVLLENDPQLKADFESKEVDTADFAKKTMGQMAFLYFLQKKGWFGVAPDKEWGTGVKNFLREIFERRNKYGENFFDDVLEPLFYEALAQDRGNDAIYPKLNNCRMPFLNGGLFEPMNGYSWETTHIRLPDELFSNDTKTKEGDIGDGILDVFDRYNFTVNESEPLEQEVAVDPEMLGKVFENLLEIKDRKSKGAFYTPREIVHYMCQESLINYLETETNSLIPKVDIESFIQQGSQIIQNDKSVIEQGGDKDGLLLPQSISNQAEELDNLLANIKVCDPAVGSGAFPLGMLNEIVTARTILGIHLKNNPSAYNLKLHAISNSIYGVDIDPGAIEIAKLRFWLSLVVEEDKPTPLPNLEHKIMQGDSLMPQYEGIELFDDDFLNNAESVNDEKNEIQEKLNEIQKEYFSLHNAGEFTAARKAEIEKEIKRLQRSLKSLNTKYCHNVETGSLFDAPHAKKIAQQKSKLLQSKIAQYVTVDSKTNKENLKLEIDHLKWDLIEATLEERNETDKLNKIKKLRKDRVKPFFIWKLEFGEVFRDSGGFDVVIGNPPYVSALEAKKTINPSVRDQYKRLFSSATGAYDLYVLFFELGMNIAKDGGSLNLITPSKFLSASYAKSLRKFILEYSLVKISDFSLIKIFESANVSTISTLICKNQLDQDVVVAKYHSLKDLREVEYITNKRKYLDFFPENMWGFLLSNNIEILMKIVTNSKTLEEVASVNASSTAAEADEYSKYIHGNKCNNCVKMINTGTIGSINNFWGVKEFKNKGEKLLTPFLDLTDVSNRRCSMYKTPKLIFKKLSKKIVATYDSKGEFASTNTNFVYNPDPRYSLDFLALYLNSKLMDFVYKQLFGGLSMFSSFQFQSPQLRVLPIPSITEINQKPFEELVKKILQAKQEGKDTADIEGKINELIYKLYDLTDEEIVIVEKASS
jgi:methylase of polypeptide subunit release factors/ribosomal protein S17E